MPPDPGSFKSRELLVPNITPEVRKALKDRGYQFQSGRSGLTRLLLPENLVKEAWEVQRQLEAEFKQNFALNYIYSYKPYFGATDDDGGEQAGAPAIGKACSPERCYGRKLIQWHEALQACASGIKIGMIDTVIDKDHPAFAGRNITSIPLGLKQDAAMVKGHWHGTGVLSVMAGAPRSGTPGLIPDAQFTAVGAFFKNSANKPETDTEHLVAALAKLDDRGVQIVNMSLVGPKDDLVHERIREMAARRGVVFVAAAGNGGAGAAAGYPAAYAEVIAVTAVDRKGGNYDHANRGPYIDVAAPGVQIWSAQPDKREGMLSGTSLAAPFVTAVVAVAYADSGLASASQRAAGDPKSTILAKLFPGGSGKDPIYGRGLVKAPAACGVKELPQQPWASIVKQVPTPQPAAMQAVGASPAAGPIASDAWQPTIERASLPPRAAVR